MRVMKISRRRKVDLSCNWTNTPHMAGHPRCRHRTTPDYPQSDDDAVIPSDESEEGVVSLHATLSSDDLL
jgi:hypothetical protein